MPNRTRKRATGQAKKRATKRTAKRATKRTTRRATTRRRTRTATTPASTSGANGLPKIRVRMYRQGLGDCFLVSFFTGQKPAHMLIDCGTLGATTTEVELPDVVQNISDETGKHLNILVGTHEHRDHVSGFGGDLFDDIDVDHSWVAWTEDPSDPLAPQIAKYKHDLIEGVRLAANALQKAPPKDPGESKAADNTLSGMRELLGFYGDLPPADQVLGAKLAKTVNEAMTAITNKGKERHFLSPGEVVEEKWLPGIRFYVLGPPKNESALRNMGEHGSPELYSISSQLSRDLAVWSAFSASGRSFPAHRKAMSAGEQQQFEAQLPFDPQYRWEATDGKACEALYPEYFKKGEEWRRIDSDWLVGGSELALQLDSYTNNTSLALAIELIEDGRILLFAADAQVGNWLSWHEYTWKVKEGGTTRNVDAANLLARTVFYKVGHHSSHNATITAKGLELMDRDDLVAMIPVDSKVALKKKWLMPADALYKRLIEKTQGRVLRSDVGWPDDKLCKDLKVKDWEDARTNSPIKFSDPVLYIDYELR